MNTIQDLLKETPQETKKTEIVQEFTLQRPAYSFAILSPKWRNWTFDKDDNSAPNITNFLKNWLDKFQENTSINAGIRFHGNVGTGKTFFAACLANEIYKRYQINVMMSTLPTLIDAKDSKLPDTEWQWNYANKCKVLVLDDIGTEAKTGYRQELLFNLINNRLMLENAITIITTNIASSDLENNRENIETARVYSRLVELCPIPITMNGKDHRIGVSHDIKRQVKEGLA